MTYCIIGFIIRHRWLRHHYHLGHDGTLHMSPPPHSSIPGQFWQGTSSKSTCYAVQIMLQQVSCVRSLVQGFEEYRSGAKVGYKILLRLDKIYWITCNINRNCQQEKSCLALTKRLTLRSMARTKKISASLGSLNSQSRRPCDKLGGTFI